MADNQYLKKKNVFNKLKISSNSTIVLERWKLLILRSTQNEKNEILFKEKNMCTLGRNLSVEVS